MAVEHGPKLSQNGNREPRAAGRHRRAHCGIAHPRRDLAREPRPHLDIKDLTTGTSLSAIDADALTVERVPRVRYYNKLRSVCCITCSVDADCW